MLFSDSPYFLRFWILNNKLMLKLPDDVQLIVEGSGVDVKYYAQLGADAASKKRLGAELVTRTFSANAGQTITFDTDNGVMIAHLICLTNGAYQSGYNKVNGAMPGYGGSVIRVSGKTLMIDIKGISGQFRISYC